MFIALANGAMCYWDTCDLVNLRTYRTSLPAFLFKMTFVSFIVGWNTSPFIPRFIIVAIIFIGLFCSTATR
jgi:hypothetical protein